MPCPSLRSCGLSTTAHGVFSPPLLTTSPHGFLGGSGVASQGGPPSPALTSGSLPLSSFRPHPPPALSSGATCTTHPSRPPPGSAWGVASPSTIRAAAQAAARESPGPPPTPHHSFLLLVLLARPPQYFSGGYAFIPHCHHAGWDHGQLPTGLLQHCDSFAGWSAFQIPTNPFLTATDS